MRSLDREAWLIKTGQEERLHGTQANLNAAFAASTAALDKMAADEDQAQPAAELRTQL